MVCCVIWFRFPFCLFVRSGLYNSFFSGSTYCDSKYGRCYNKCDLTCYCRVLLLLTFFVLLSLVLWCEACNFIIL
jgi:hypothetical protein